MARLLSPKWLAGIGIALILLFLVLPNYLVEVLWMDAVGYEAVFWKTLGYKAGLFVAAFLVVGGFFAANFYYLVQQLPPLWASRFAREGEAPRMGNVRLTRGHLRTGAYAFAAVLALIFAGSFAARWEAFLHFLSGADYGMAEPVFGNDVAFYMLRLPFIEVVQGTLVAMAVLALLVLGTVYVLMGEVEVQGGRLRVRPSVMRHLGLNAVILLVGWAVGFLLNRYGLLQSSGAVYGAGYTDLTARLPALWLLFAATLCLAGLLVWAVWRYRFRWLLYGAGAYALLFVGGLLVIPSLLQSVSVAPNELDMERPYLKRNIKFTREAFHLNKVDTRSYPAQTTLTPEQVVANQATLDNVRLWDPRLLIDSYKQIQEIRTYYQFYNLDIGRYHLNGEYRQVMLAGRELVQRLPANSWENRHLRYTHGYGSVMNLVAQQGTGSTPELLLQNLPPETDYSELEVKEPAIYYGERTPTYRLVNTGAQELEYPKGEDNVYVNYKGDGGVPVGSFWRQALFSWTQSDYNILLSDYLREGSRIQFWNRVQQRIRKIAPFLKLDQDPYLVLSDQRQYWVQDAYTTAERFPYSEPARGGRFRDESYIRNSVKIVVDAYNGDVNFYVTDKNDPVLKTYRKAFPGLFKPLSAISEDLKSHLRYPQDLFEAQVEKYRRYHMQNEQVFYNNEDLWTRPEERYQGNRITMEPYYILARLPDEDDLEYMQMTPYTPKDRDNMIGWIAAKSDFPDYGELVVYELPKEKLIYGPSQVEARISQNPEISEQLTLWDQQGSRVVRGNLIVVPIEETFLYVEPVFLIAQNRGAQIPELRRVIVAYGDYVAMENSLGEALSSVLGTHVAAAEEGVAAPPAGGADAPTDTLHAPADTLRAPAGPPRRGPPPQLENAREVLQRAEEALSAGDFSTFGEEFEALKQALEEDQSQQQQDASASDTTYSQAGGAAPAGSPSETAGTGPGG